MCRMRCKEGGTKAVASYLLQHDSSSAEQSAREKLLESDLTPELQTLLPADCGAGVGRVTNELLLHLFHEVDLMEPSRPLLECSQQNLSKKRMAVG